MGRASEKVGQIVWRSVVATTLTGVLGVAACGNTEHHSDEPPMAGRNAGGAAAAAAVSGSAGQAPASGSGGSASAGTGQTAGTAGGPPGTGGAPPRFPLIVGDEACPPAAPESLSCQQPGATCVYRGIESGLSLTYDPMRCVCDGDLWACVGSDEKGETACPIARQPGPTDPCPAPGKVCIYVLPVALAHCYCSQDTETGGAGGAGGTEAAPRSSWLCGA